MPGIHVFLHVSQVRRGWPGFEPSHQMGDLLRRTSASNVSVHEIALSDQTGNAELFIPQDGYQLIHGLASLERAVNGASKAVASINVPTAPRKLPGARSASMR